MATLTDEQKHFIVQALACYDTPQQVALAVKEEFGLTILRQQVAAYDPTKVAGRDLAKKWVAIFDATRKRFLENASDIPIAQQTYRLRALQRLHDKAALIGNAPLAAQLLEQAAKEVGGAYGDRRRLEVTGKDGAPVEHKHIHELSDDDLARIAAGGA